MATQLGRHPSRLCHAPKIMEDNGSPIHKYAQIYIQINRIGHIYSTRQNYGKKNVSIYRRRLSMIEKLRTLFFHNYCFHNLFFSIIMSVTVCPSIRNLNAF